MRKQVSALLPSVEGFSTSLLPRIWHYSYPIQCIGGMNSIQKERFWSASLRVVQYPFLRCTQLYQALGPVWPILLTLQLVGLPDYVLWHFILPLRVWRKLCFLGLPSSSCCLYSKRQIGASLFKLILSPWWSLDTVSFLCHPLPSLWFHYLCCFARTLPFYLFIYFEVGLEFAV